MSTGGASAPRVDTESDTDAGNDPLAAILLPPRVPCQGNVVREFAFDPPVDVSRWATRTDSPEAMPSLSEELVDGSPKAGAVLVSTTFTDSTQSVQMETVLETALSTSCLSARIKVIEAPENPDLSNTKAGWYLFAVDADGCYAQSEIGHSPWWRYDITQAGVWYEVTANTNQLTTSQMCTHFDPARTQKLGIGIATSSSRRWPARFVVDTIRAY
jgi:hypothetical protein